MGCCQKRKTEKLLNEFIQSKEQLIIEQFFFSKGIFALLKHKNNIKNKNEKIITSIIKNKNPFFIFSQVVKSGSSSYILIIKGIITNEKTKIMIKALDFCIC